MVGGQKLAVVTGASSGIGLELARCCAGARYDLLIAANEPEIENAAATLRQSGAHVESINTDLSSREGVDHLYEAISGRSVDALLANAGCGLGGAFLDQQIDGIDHVVRTNISGTIYLVHRIGNDMRRRNAGKILITGSIAGLVPGSFHAVYNASKAFLNSFSFALREELRDTDLTVTCLMPGATETSFFDRAGMTNTEVGQAKKDDAAYVARVGFEAMLRGDGDVVSGLKNKVQSSFANITPATILAKQHRKMAGPKAH